MGQRKMVHYAEPRIHILKELVFSGIKAYNTNVSLHHRNNELTLQKQVSSVAHSSMAKEQIHQRGTFTCKKRF